MARSSPTRRTASGKAEPRVWQRMLSGRRLDLMDPSPMDVEIEDIAHGLARVARWNGQTTGPYAFSVAQHSVIVEGLVGELKPAVTPAMRLMALLHDAPEYVVGDMISPFKTVMGPGYKSVEARLERAIHLRFGLSAQTPPALKKLIKKADLICAWFEATQLAGFAPTEADGFFGRPPDGVTLTLAPQSPNDAQSDFIARFETLLAELDKVR
ncbi:MAG: HD family hydrolase [Pseudomonadota bacterium]